MKKRNSTKRTSEAGKWRRTFRAIRHALPPDSIPSVSQLADERVTPFQILISTMISLRTKDEVTLAASRRLFAEAQTPESMRNLPPDRIAELIYPAGFYRTKAVQIRQAAETIIERHAGSVPQTAEELTALAGVGPKTANLVLGLGFGIPAICVDTHVHRICNRIGWVSTSTPEKTEIAIARLVPIEHWIELNGLFVAFGRQICTPISPRCSRCPISPPAAKSAPHAASIETFACLRVGVGSSR